jgi:hypothetical protein
MIATMRIARPGAHFAYQTAFDQGGKAGAGGAGGAADVPGDNRRGPAGAVAQQIDNDLIENRVEVWRPGPGPAR